jgi:hypothetical protein
MVKIRPQDIHCRNRNSGRMERHIEGAIDQEKGHGKFWKHLNDSVYDKVVLLTGTLILKTCRKVSGFS